MTSNTNLFLQNHADIVNDFPILSQKVNGHDLHYLDSGASAQKPLVVINKLRDIYQKTYANVHRGAYHFSAVSTSEYEEARTRIAQFLNADNENEIIFTSGTTGAINLLAYSYARHLLKAGDEVIISEMEHHSNMVPWQMMRDDCGIILKYIPILDDGSLDMDGYSKLLSKKTKLVSVAHVSNVLGTVNPIKKMAEMAHQVGAVICVDGSQAVMHEQVDVQQLGVDFYAFTGHKIYGPNAIGVLYGKSELLARMSPFFGGGDMIKSVSLAKTIYADPPARFEAGTPPIIEAIALKTAIDYIVNIGLDKIKGHELSLLKYATDALQTIKGLKIIGTAPNKGPILSFVIDGVHPHDLATILDQQGVAVRAGHHCAEPLMGRFSVIGTTRASLALYNNSGDIDALVKGINLAKKILT